MPDGIQGTGPYADEEIAEVLSKADALKKWAEEVYTYAQNEAVVNHKAWRV